MHLHIIAVSNRQPDWVEAAFADYTKRFTGPARLHYQQIRLTRHRDAERRKAEEGRKLLAAVPRGGHIVALDETGDSRTTRQLAERLDAWMAAAVRPYFLIGGPDGLDRPVLDAAHERWCLSALTLPHGLARIIVAESLYRAFSLLSGHPYHRD